MASTVPQPPPHGLRPPEPKHQSLIHQSLIARRMPVRCSICVTVSAIDRGFGDANRERPDSAFGVIIASTMNSLLLAEGNPGRATTVADATHRTAALVVRERHRAGDLGCSLVAYSDAYSECRTPVNRPQAAREGSGSSAYSGVVGGSVWSWLERPQRRSPARVLSLQPRQTGSMRPRRRRFPRARMRRRRASASDAVSGSRVRALRRRAPRSASLESLNLPNSGCHQASRGRLKEFPLWPRESAGPR